MAHAIPQCDPSEEKSECTLPAGVDSEASMACYNKLKDQIKVTEPGSSSQVSCGVPSHFRCKRNVQSWWSTGLGECFYNTCSHPHQAHGACARTFPIKSFPFDPGTAASKYGLPKNSLIWTIDPQARTHPVFTAKSTADFTQLLNALMNCNGMGKYLQAVYMGYEELEKIKRDHRLDDPTAYQRIMFYELNSQLGYIVNDPELAGANGKGYFAAIDARVHGLRPQLGMEIHTDFKLTSPASARSAANGESRIGAKAWNYADSLSTETRRKFAAVSLIHEVMHSIVDRILDARMNYTTEQPSCIQNFRTASELYGIIKPTVEKLGCDDVGCHTKLGIRREGGSIRGGMVNEVINFLVANPNADLKTACTHPSLVHTPSTAVTVFDQFLRKRAIEVRKSRYYVCGRH